MQKPILLSSALAILFFFIMWMLFPVLNHVLLKEIIGSSKSTVLSTASMGEEQAIGLKTALSFGILPLLSCGIFELIRRIKNLEYPMRKLGAILSVVSIGYLIGFCMKVVLLLIYVVDMEAYRLSPDIANSISLSQIYFYDYALVCAVIVGLLIFLFAKRKAFPNTL